jgi:hypothetical protein
LGDPLKGNLLLFYKPLHLEAQQVSTRIEVRRHQALFSNQSIPSLRVLSESVPSPVQGQSLEIAKKWADEWGMSVEDILASQDERFPKAVVAPKPKFVMGGPLVSKERLEDLPTNMRYLHAWYMNEAKNGRIMIIARVPWEYYGRPEDIHVYFDELF